MTIPAKQRDRSYLLWAFLLPFCLMLLIYLLDRVFPFGKNSVLVLDLNGQYVGFYEALRAFVYGDGSLLYSFSRSLGGEMMGIYAYYLASPLSYLVALFPAENITEALLFIFILKAGLSGLTFGIYLHKKQFLPPCETVMFSLMYALCSFAIVMQHNSMWMDNLILLPILTLGIEGVIQYRRYRLFVASLALCLLSNFYIGFMTCIYVLLYFFYYFYAFAGSAQHNPQKENQHYLRALLRMALYALLAIGIAAIILLTVAYSLSFGKADFTDPNYLPYLQFDPFSFFAKLLPGVYDTVEPQGLPFVFTGTLTLLLVPLYFLNRRFARRERAVTGIFLSVFYVCMSVSSLDMLWHGGQAPNWLNYRYSFFLCFILLVTAARAYARLSDLRTRTVFSVTVVLLALLAPTAVIAGNMLSLPVILVSAALILVFTAILYFLQRSGRRLRQYLSLLLFCLVVAEMFYNGNAMLAGLHDDVGATSRDDYRTHQEMAGTSVDWVKAQDSDFYRMELLYHRVTNDTMELGFRGLTNSTSTLNAKTIQFLYRMGLLSTSHWSEYYGSTMVLDSLLGIRYVLTPLTQPALSPAYTLHHQTAYHAVYRNPYALSLAFAAAGTVRDYEMGGLRSPLLRQNEILSSLLGQEGVTCYIAQEATVSYENVLPEGAEHAGQEYWVLYSNAYLENEEAIANGTISPDDVTDPDASVTFTTTLTDSGQLYFYIPSDDRGEVTMYVDGARYGTLFGDQNDFVKGLGYVDAGTEISVTLKMTDCSYFAYPTNTAFFYVEDDETARAALSQLATGNMTIEQFTEDSFIGQITTTEARPTVQTTIPYDAGWRVTVDGVAVPTYETLDALLAFDTTPGTHTIEMVYRPTCYIVGSCISIVSVLLFLAWMLIETLWRQRILCPAEGGRIDRLLTILLSRDPLPQEPNYLSDEEMEKAEHQRTATQVQQNAPAVADDEDEKAEDETDAG